MDLRLNVQEFSLIGNSSLQVLGLDQEQQWPLRLLHFGGEVGDGTMIEWISSYLCFFRCLGSHTRFGMNRKVKMDSAMMMMISLISKRRKLGEGTVSSAPNLITPWRRSFMILIVHVMIHRIILLPFLPPTHHHPLLSHFLLSHGAPFFFVFLSGVPTLYINTGKNHEQWW